MPSDPVERRVRALRQLKFTALLIVVVSAMNYELILGKGDRFLQLMDLERTLFLQGEVWRFLTCHLVHISFKHYWVDLAATAALGVIYEPDLKRHWTGIFFACAVTISVMFLTCIPRLEYYRGLSGISHGLFAAGMMIEWYHTRPKSLRRMLFYCVATGFVGKVVYETVSGNFLWGMSQDVAVMGNPIPEAHLTGMLTGTLYAWLVLRKQHRTQPDAGVGEPV